MLNPAERVGQAFIGLAPWTSPPLHFLCSVSFSSFPPLPPPTRVLAGARCNFQLVQCDTSKKRTGDSSLWTGRWKWCGVHTLPRGGGSVLSTLNGHMLHISRGREQRQGGKRGRKSESTDTRGGHFRDCWEVGGMSALVTWHQHHHPRPSVLHTEPQLAPSYPLAPSASSILSASSALHLFVLVELMQHIWLTCALLTRPLGSQTQNVITGT